MRDVDPDRVGALVRAVAREEILPRFRALTAADVFAKATESDPDDVVTAADLAVERRLTPALAALLPGSVVVGEEAAAARPALLDALRGEAPVWLVDPLDGTRNFAAGRPAFASMVALVHGGETRAAWLYLPAEDALLVAEAGSGAWMDGRRLRTGDPPPAEVRPRGTLYTRFMDDAARRTLTARARTEATIVRQQACAGIEYAGLVRGAKTFVVYVRLLPWDHAPGALLLAEAGGAARHVDGRPYRPVDRRGPLVLARHAAAWRDLRRRLFA